MFIRNGKRFNIYATREINGVRYQDFTSPELRAKFNISEVADPVRESEETHYVQELDESPYIINTPKPERMLLEASISKLKSYIEVKERENLMPRATREFMLLFMESQASADTLVQNHGYQAVKAFDLDITTKRTELSALISQLEVLDNATTV